MRLSMLFSFLLFAQACSHHDTVPSDLLSPKKMRLVMYDAMRADEIVEFQSLRDSTYKKTLKRDSLYQAIFDLYNTNRAQFKNSLKFYQTRPDLLKDVVESMQKNHLADTLYKTRKPDTIRKKKVHSP